MNFFGHIRQWFIYATQVLVYLALECYSYGWPLEILGGWFDHLSDFTAEVAGYLYDASDWYDEVVGKLGDILGWSTIWSYITSHIPNLEDIRDWFYYWHVNVLQLVDSWWTSTTVTVQGWIDEAKQWTRDLADDLQRQVDELRVRVESIPGAIPDLTDILQWFGSWTGNVQLVIDSWWTGAMGDVRDLIDTAFLERESWWSGWADFKDRVAAFFNDPLEFIWTRFTDWFLGPEV